MSLISPHHHLFTNHLPLQLHIALPTEKYTNVLVLLPTLLRTVIYPQCIYLHDMFYSCGTVNYDEREHRRSGLSLPCQAQACSIQINHTELEQKVIYLPHQISAPTDSSINGSISILPLTELAMRVLYRNRQGQQYIVCNKGQFIGNAGNM